MNQYWIDSIISTGQTTHQDSKKYCLWRISSCLLCTEILPAAQTHPFIPNKKLHFRESTRFELKAFERSASLARREAVLLTTPQRTVSVVMTVEIKTRKNSLHATRERVRFQLHSDQAHRLLYFHKTNHSARCGAVTTTSTAAPADTWEPIPLAE